MPRLIDYILTQRRQLTQIGAAYVSPASWAAQEEALRAWLPTVPHVVADNIDEFSAHYKWNEIENAGLDPRDVPGLTPPFPEFWIEWKYADPTFRTDLGITHAGAVVECFEARPDEHADYRWEFAILPFLLHDDGQVGHIVWRPIACTTAEGDLVRCHAVPSPFVKDRIEDESQAAGHRNAALAVLTTVLISICFMNCKNVKLIDVAPVRKLSAAYKRRKGQWLQTYKTIDIYPMSRIVREKLDAEGGTGTGKRAMHIMRGHIKHYTEDSKLFGKHAGNYFWHSHVRGTLAAGEVKPSYKIRLEGKKHA